MSDPYFFGYGSLVNINSHDYPNAQPATLNGWRRAWVATPRYGAVLLTAVPTAGHSIKGLIAAVPGSDWEALDMREGGYTRLTASEHVDHGMAAKPEIAVYAVHPDRITNNSNHMILLSYLDVVVQGFYNVYGSEGVQHFFDTTDNWDTLILDDRDNPIYPRHQKLTGVELAFVDDNLARLSAQVKQRHEAPLSPKF